MQGLKGDRLFEMTNLVQHNTGLPFIIWISPKIDNQEPKIQVQGDYSGKLKNDFIFTVTISDQPEIIGNTGALIEKDIKLAKEFVITNKDTLLDFWNERDPDIVSIVSRLIKISK